MMYLLIAIPHSILEIFYTFIDQVTC